MAEVERVEERDFRLEEIVEADRLRPVSDTGVAAVEASLAEVGRILSPVWLRKVKDGSYLLLDGGHRIEAARRAGLDTVPGIAFRCNTDQARLMEIDGNLAGAELTPLDTAVFLAARKRVYEKMHPETLPKTGAELVARRWNTADTMSVVSFAKVTAEKFGLSDRHVRRLLAAGSMLAPDEVARLRQAERAPSLKDLAEIGKIGDAPERYDVVAALAEDRAKNAAEARRAYRVKVHGAPPAKDPVEAALQDLLTRWSRAPKEAKRRFVREANVELFGLLKDLDGGLAE